jgi:microcystin-dependent protein
MALPPLQDLLDLLADNSAGDITAADMQYIVTSLYNGIDEGAGGGGGSIPVGGYLFWSDSTTPTGFLDCDGQEVSRATYADLFALIGTKYGVGDNVTTFNVPDARGLFLRIQDAGAGVDPDAASRTDRGDGTIGDNVGTKQLDALENFTGTIAHGGYGTVTGVFENVGSFVGVGTNAQTNYTAKLDPSLQARTSTETRGNNMYTRLLIRAVESVTGFVSDPIALTTGSKAITATAHGLGLTPKRVDAYLLCDIADLNYSPSNRVYLKGLRWDGANNNGLELSADSTNLTPIQINDIKILDKTAFTLSTITYANWSLILEAAI